MNGGGDKGSGQAAKNKKNKTNWRKSLRLKDPPPQEKDKAERQLLDAAGRGDVAKARQLLKEGTDTGWKNNLGQSAIHWAAGHGYVECLQVLLEYQAKVDDLTVKNWTPLHYASYNGHIEVIMLLLKHGANPHAENSQGKTPIDVAKSPSIADIIQGKPAQPSSSTSSTTVQSESGEIKIEGQSETKSEDWGKKEEDWLRREEEWNKERESRRTEEDKLRTELKQHQIEVEQLRKELDEKNAEIEKLRGGSKGEGHSVKSTKDDTDGAEKPEDDQGTGSKVTKKKPTKESSSSSSSKDKPKKEKTKRSTKDSGGKEKKKPSSKSSSKSSEKSSKSSKDKDANGAVSPKGN